MALIKFGGGIAEMRGSIAGTVFSRNKAGAYARNRVTPVNPQSDLQTSVRSTMAALAVVWNSTLSDANRAAWEVYAASVAMTNRLGETMYLSGYNHFIRSAMTLVTTGSEYVLQGPAELSLPETDPTLTIDLQTDQTLDFTYDDTMDWCDEDGGGLVIYAGQPQLATRNFFDGPWRYAVRVLGNSITPPTSPSEGISLPWSAQAGQKMWFYARIHRADGRITEKFLPSADTFPSA